MNCFPDFTHAKHYLVERLALTVEPFPDMPQFGTLRLNDELISKARWQEYVRRSCWIETADRAQVLRALSINLQDPLADSIVDGARIPIRIAPERMGLITQVWCAFEQDLTLPGFAELCFSIGGAQITSLR